MIFFRSIKPPVPANPAFIFFCTEKRRKRPEIFIISCFRKRNEIVAVIFYTLRLKPVLIRMIIPKQSKSLLEATSAWLTRYNRPIVIAVSLVFGLLFLYQGASGLLQ